MEAALPPLWQTVREIKSILSDEQLGNYFSSAEQIQEIRKEGDEYFVKGTASSCRVEIIYLPAEDGRVGPASFKLIFHNE